MKTQKFHHDFTTLFIILGLSLFVSIGSFGQSGKVSDDRFFRNADTNGDQKLSYAEFGKTELASFIRAKRGEDAVAKIFKLQDRDGDEAISLQESQANLVLGKGEVAESVNKKNKSESSVSSVSTAARFPEGANCLFIGHSFFVPVAKSFERLASVDQFPKHRVRTVFSGGQSGSPDRLWDDERKKAEIKKILATGEIDLLGMTLVSERGSLEDYQKWMDFALKHNPKTQFMVGSYWMVGGTRLDSGLFKTITQVLGVKGGQDVAQLRAKKYPVHFIDYGQVCPEMKILFDAGKLPDIDVLVGRSRKALFRDDGLGHGGSLMHELCALTWAPVLYDANLDDLAHSDFSDQAKAIVEAAIEKNRQYN